MCPISGASARRSWVPSTRRRTRPATRWWSARSPGSAGAGRSWCATTSWPRGIWPWSSWRPACSGSAAGTNLTRPSHFEIRSYRVKVNGSCITTWWLIMYKPPVSRLSLDDRVNLLCKRHPVSAVSGGAGAPDTVSAPRRAASFQALTLHPRWFPRPCGDAA